MDERAQVIVELQTVLADFWYDVDARGGNDAASFYTEDGVFEASERTYSGREMIEKFYRFRRDRGARVAMHVVTNFRAQLIGPGEAVSTWYMTLYAADGAPVLPTTPPIQIALATDHSVKCDDGRWRYRHRKFETLFKGGVPTTTMTAEYETSGKV